MPIRVLPSSDPQRSWPLHGVKSTREIESAIAKQVVGIDLMQRAGLAVARCTLALAPHADRIWIACGSGNNGGDGLEAALHLKQWGKDVWLTWLGEPDSCPSDALAAYKRVQAEGLHIQQEAPATFDFCVDALLGIGQVALQQNASQRHIGRNERMSQWIAIMNAGQAPVLAVDLPTGLNGDNGQTSPNCVRAQFTLSLLTLKPGQFTATGRDVCGEIWLDDLLVSWPNTGMALVAPGTTVTARLGGLPSLAKRRHASHKGSYGDVGIMGGAKGMVGAAILAGRAAARAGAGRTFVSLVDETPLAVDPDFPELMLRTVDKLDQRLMSVVIGCGGGAAVALHMARALDEAKWLVIDADGLNAISADPTLQQGLKRRSQELRHTVLTPHPLEAARLLETTAAEVQQDRLQHAQRLAEQFGCVVVLKGSGSVIAGPGMVPVINPTGNAKLATAGTGDVLAGMLGAALGALGKSATLEDVQATSAAVVHQHGEVADRWPSGQGFTASDLIRNL